jgi:hypothetical protein
VAERDDPEHEAHVAMLYDHHGFTTGYQYLCSCQAAGSQQPTQIAAIREHFTHLADIGIRPKEKIEQ